MKPSTLQKIRDSLVTRVVVWALVLLIAAPSVWASNLMVRVPVQAFEHAPVTKNFDFGSAAVGSELSTVLRFTNRSSKATSMGAISTSGQATILNNGCVGTLDSYETCDIQVGFNVTSLGSNAGSVSINHSEGKQPDVFILTAQGIALSAEVRFDETLINFGQAPIQSSVPAYRTATLRNTGDKTVFVDDVRLGSPSTIFQVVSHNCGELPPKGTCLVELSYRPLFVGNHSIPLRYVLDTGELAPITGTMLVGSGVAGKPGVSSTQLNFEGVPAGQESDPQDLVVSNLGNGDLIIEDVGIRDSAGQESAFFTIKNTTCSPILAPGASCRFSITYRPQDDTARSAIVRLRFGQSLTQQLSVQLWGKSAPQVALLQFQPSSLGFGTAGVGQASTKTLKIQSVGTKPVNVAGYTVTGANASDFTILNGTNCVGALNPGMECELQIRFTAGAEGARAAALSATSNSAPAPLAVPMTGQGALGTLVAQPSSLSFSGVEVGQTDTQTLRLRNQGPAEVRVGAITLGTPGAPFTIGAGCAGVTLAVNAECAFNVIFVPTSTNSVSTSLKISHTGTGSVLNVPLSGSALPSKEGLLQVTPAPLNFGSVPVLATQSTTMTIRSVGAKAVNISTLNISGPQASEFTITNASNCIKLLAPNSQCAVSISFRPTAEGARNAQLSIASDATTAPSPVALTGSGTAGLLVAQPSSLAFGTKEVGASETPQLTLRNQGGAPVLIQGLTLASSNGVFTLGSGCVNNTLAAGAACSVNVTFKPTAAQSYMGSIVVSHNGQGGSLSVPLSGEGKAPPQPKASGPVLTCPATAGVNQTFTCKARVESIGEANLSASSVSYRIALQDTTTWSNLTPGPITCSSGSTTNNILPGGYCEYPVTTSRTQAGTYVVELQLLGNVTFQKASASVAVQAPSLVLQTTSHPQTQQGSSSQAQHTLTNTSSFAVNLSGVTSNVTQITVDRSACPTALGPGASCTLTTTCTMGAANTADLTATLNVLTTPSTSTSGTVKCPVSFIDVSVGYAGPVTNEAGAYTYSGNWVRITNNGNGPVIIGGLYPATGWALLASASTNDSCTNGKVLQKGQSCLVLEHLNGTQSPGVAVTGLQRIRVNSGTAIKDVIWTSQEIILKGLGFTPLEPLGPLTVGVPGTARYELVNQAPSPLALPLNFNSSSGSLRVTGHNCPAALGAGAKCVVNLSYTGTAPGNFNLKLDAISGYNALIGGQQQSGTPSSWVLGSVTIPVLLENAKLVIEPGTNNPAINPGQTATLTHILRNESKTAVQLTGSPTISNTSQYQLTGGTCVSGLSLAPNSTCTILVTFSPPVNATSAVQNYVYVPTQAGQVSAGFKGNLVAVGDIQVTLTGPTSVLAGANNNYNFSVRNSSSQSTTVQLRLGRTNYSGASSSLNLFSGGPCGTYNTSSGSLSMQSAPSPTSTVSCSPQVSATSDTVLTLTIAPNGLYSGQVTYNAGSSSGSYLVSASVSGYTIFDTNPGNDAVQVNTQVNLPAFDISVAGTLSNTTAVYPAASEGHVTYTVRRLDSNSTPVNATLSFGQTSASGGATLGLGTLECLSVSPGATCSPSGALTLPGSATVTLRKNFTASSVFGRVSLKATLSGTALGMTETALSNNVSSLDITVRRPLYLNACYFASSRVTYYDPPIGNPPHYSNLLIHDKWVRQHIADVTLMSPGSSSFKPKAYRMYNVLTGEQDGPEVNYAIKGTNIGMLPGTAILDINTWAGWGASPGGYGEIKPCAFGTKPSDVHYMCNGEHGANGWRLYRDYGSPYGAWFGTNPNGNGGYLDSGAPGNQVTYGNPSGVYRVVWSELTPYPRCLVPGSTTARTWVQ